MKKTITLRHGRKIPNPELQKMKRTHNTLIWVYGVMVIGLLIVSYLALNAIDQQVCGSASPEQWQAMYCEEVN